MMPDTSYNVQKYIAFAQLEWRIGSPQEIAMWALRFAHSDREFSIRLYRKDDVKSWSVFNVTFEDHVDPKTLTYWMFTFKPKKMPAKVSRDLDQVSHMLAKMSLNHEDVLSELSRHIEDMKYFEANVEAHGVTIDTPKRSIFMSADPSNYDVLNFMFDSGVYDVMYG